MTQFKEKIKVYFTKPYLKRYLLYFFGITLLSFGVALTYKSSFGASAWDALHYNFHIGIPMEFRYINTISSVILVCIAYLIEWKKPDLKMITPVALSFIFGSLIDIFKFLIPSVAGTFILWSIIYLVTVLLVIGIGLNIIRYCNFGLPAIDQLCLAIANRFKLSFGQGKFIGEVFALIGTVLAGLYFGYQEEYFNLGITTIIFILFLGTIVDFFRNTVFRILKGIPIMDLFADDLTEADINYENNQIASRVVIEHNKKFMILYLKDRDFYIFPGVKKENSRSLESSLRREVFMKTGYKIKIYEEELIINEYFVDSSFENHYFKAKLKNKLVSKDFENNENIEVLWLDMNSLADLLSNYDTKDKFGPQIMWREFLVIINTI